MGDREEGEVRYRAFLSYSHKDATAAARLHRRLEAYRIPRRLAGGQTPRGPVPARLWPIFRDREELPAATDLSQTVREALAQSGALIILCSPHAAASLWVVEEIRVFRELHPDRPVLAAILDGDPPDCFPDILRAFGQDGTWHEPLATDLRRDRDGPRLGLLKLVAGITGLGLDDLVQRDAARRVRRVMAVTVGALAAVLVMAVLVVMAISARREAERQRAEAEGQIEFMLTDLRSRLRESDGRLLVMATVNRRALQYYDRQDPGDLSAQSLERRARILQAMGEDYVQAADLDAAMATFRQAHRITEEQLAREPNSPQRIFAHGQSDYWVGRIHELRRDWPHAVEQYVRYQAAAERLIAIDPNNPDYMLEMAWGASNRGVIQRDGRRDFAAAEGSFNAAVQWFDRAIRARPRDADRRDLANAYANLADTFYLRELWRPALAIRLREYGVAEALLRRNPTDVQASYRLANVERAIARLRYRLGDLPGAIDPLLNAYGRARALTARDPQNAQWLLLKTKVECDLVTQAPAGDRRVDPAQLRVSILAAADRLGPANPRLQDIQLCLNRVRTDHLSNTGRSI